MNANIANEQSPVAVPGMRCELDLFGGVQRRIPGNVALREPRIVANAGNTQSCGPLRLDAGCLD